MRWATFAAPDEPRRSRRSRRRRLHSRTGTGRRADLPARRRRQPPARRRGARRAKPRDRRAARRCRACSLRFPRPPSVRDFYAFEQHVRTARERRGLEMEPDWYELPVFYFSNPASIIGDGDDVAIPVGCDELDFELEVAAVVGRDGRDLDPASADRAHRRLHDHERLERARPAAARDEAQPRAGEGQGLRDDARPVPRHARRAAPTSRRARPTTSR